ncbi:hypothetical protein [Natranaeroarchaeum aerophilus]|uniref:Uncharacterized protein n=1 Tax=Natranaeroarchaeum aerophilus TaxID=2917711 RepID=A0AAE3FSQ5_9EURY|nr:hypothetical protein [Natranaeroarchaeum aerophilus]MCL9814233.1 hypothetical protein [Natranaeroarchaeum aerophilus]
MKRDQSDGDDPYVEARIPRELHDRVERLFREYRGYDSSSVQESLSVICDLAEAELDTEESGSESVTASAPDTDETVTDVTGDDPSGSASSTTDSPGTIRTAIDDVFPADWDASEETADRLSLIVSHYLTADGSTRLERENTALSATATRHGMTPEQLRTEIVDEIYGADTLPGELASEFFSEALAKVEQRLERAETDVLSAVELVGDGSTDTTSSEADSPDEPESPLDLGSGSSALPEGLADDMASDGGAVQSVDDRIDNLFTGPNGLTEIGIESLVDGAATDCEVCGEQYSVVDLQTTTEASDDRRVNLVCADCLPE